VKEIILELAIVFTTAAPAFEDLFNTCIWFLLDINTVHTTVKKDLTWQWHIQMEIVIRDSLSLPDSINATLSWLDRVCRPRCWFVSNKSNFVPNYFTQCCWKLFNSNKSLNCNILVNPEMLLEDVNSWFERLLMMAKRNFVVAKPWHVARRWQNANSWLKCC